MEFILAGNWKMNKTLEESKDFAIKFAPVNRAGVSTVLFPPSVVLYPLKETFSEKQSSTVLGAQNCSEHESGAFTGELSAQMLKDFAYCLVGHSERRQYFGESNEVLHQKTLRIVESGARPMYCIGETLEQRQKGEVFGVLSEQLKRLWDMKPFSLVVAYEPVWAIGTGVVAKPTEVAEVHQFLREQFVSYWGTDGEQVPLLYGGSVKPANCLELSRIPHVNGFLVGGASLKPDSFTEILERVDIDV